MANRIVDLSVWEDGIDYDAVLRHSDGAILKGGMFVDGVFTADPTFKKHYEELKNRFFPVGVYFYGNSSTPTEWEEEACNILDFLEDKQFELPIFYHSIESSTTAISVILNKLKNNGYYVGYNATSQNLNRHIDTSKLHDYILWVSQPDDTLKPGIYATYHMWQYSLEYKIDSFTTGVSYVYEDFEAIIKYQKLNGFGS